MSLTSALNWYHKKIGAYDKKLWEKSVDQRILRGVCAIPRKNARLKTELIDVDLVQGSAFAKAKPQDSWIVSTISGIKRILLFPVYFSWWQLQTNTSITCVFVALYVLQICALYLYFFTDVKEFSDVPIFEIITPIVMMLLLGVMHSQIVSTFTPSQKSHRKHIPKPKRRRVKVKNSFDFEQDNSSPDSDSDYKPYDLDEAHSSQTHDMQDDSYIISQSIPIAGKDTETDQSCTCKRAYRSGHQLHVSLSDSDLNVENSPEHENCVEALKHFSVKEKNVSNLEDHTQITKTRNFSERSYNSQLSRDSAYVEYNQTSLESLKCNEGATNDDHKVLRQNSKDSVFQSSIEKNEVSSSEEYFIAKKPVHTSEQWKNYVIEEKICCSSDKNCCNKSCLKPKSVVCRRYSDIGPVFKKSQLSHLTDQEVTHSADSILAVTDADKSCHTNSNQSFTNFTGHENHLKKRAKLRFNNIKSLMELPGTTRRFSSSCESHNSSPNTPIKNQTSDLEWPLMSNTDCNSDSIACSSDYSKDLSDVTPAENPFAWEILERSKKLSNKDSNASGKISCTIWEGSECKKADLTALDICSAIIQKVDSIHHTTEYLYVGMFFAIGLSFLPLMFRLKNGADYDMQDVASDVFTLTVPSSEEVVRITDGLIDIMWGEGFRIKAIVSIIMLERFCLSLAFFFLLSVAEKTFKQRFLYAKHFCYLTSSRGAKRSDLPHFRLNKVKNIKTWLSIRSYMKKLGPQRSVDVIVSITFILEVCVVSYLCIQLLKETSQFSDQLLCWELLFWTLALGIYLLRFMIIGTKINKKYRNLSVLITEQINLYLHMEQKPHKKEELILANNVLKLAADLLKELESPFKISGICANSYLYNITKVVVLSAFSAMLTDVLGFKLKLYKIKLK